MALQYLDALKALAAGESTKWIVPMELAELSRPIAGAMRSARISSESEVRPPPAEVMARHGRRAQPGRLAGPHRGGRRCSATSAT